MICKRFFLIRFSSFCLKVGFFFFKINVYKKDFFSWIDRVEVKPFCKTNNYLLIFVVFISSNFPSTISNSSPMIWFSINTLVCIKVNAVRFTFIIPVFRYFKVANLLKFAKSVFKEVGLQVLKDNMKFRRKIKVPLVV